MKKNSILCLILEDLLSRKNFVAADDVLKTIHDTHQPIETAICALEVTALAGADTLPLFKNRDMLYQQVKNRTEAAYGAEEGLRVLEMVVPQ